MTWISNIFRKKKPTPAPTPAPVPVPGAATFIESFATIDPSKWMISTWSAPGTNSTHKGTFSAANVTIVDGMLCLKLSQTKSGTMFTSAGGEIATNQSLGYGTYEFVARASTTSTTPVGVGTPVSGSVTGCFNYLAGSATEIDVEVEGGSRSALTQFTSWVGVSTPNQTLVISPTGSMATPDQTFFTYRFVWSPGKIVFSRDGVIVATFTNVVPTQPAQFIFNHWGTNDPNWGGTATPGVDRFMYVKSFSFTPL